MSPVEEVVLGEGDLVDFIGARLSVLSCLVLHPDPREDAAFYDRKVELWIVDQDSVAQTQVQGEVRVIPVVVCFVGKCEGVTHPQVDCVHVTAPQHGVVCLLVLQGGGQGEGVLSDTALDI